MKTAQGQVVSIDVPLRCSHSSFLAHKGAVPMITGLESRLLWARPHSQVSGWSSVRQKMPRGCSHCELVLNRDRVRHAAVTPLSGVIVNDLDPLVQNHTIVRYFLWRWHSSKIAAPTPASDAKDPDRCVLARRTVDACGFLCWRPCIRGRSGLARFHSTPISTFSPLPWQGPLYWEVFVVRVRPCRRHRCHRYSHHASGWITYWHLLQHFLFQSLLELWDHSVRMFRMVRLVHRPLVYGILASSITQSRYISLSCEMSPSSKLPLMGKSWFLNSSDRTEEEFWRGIYGPSALIDPAMRGWSEFSADGLLLSMWEFGCKASWWYKGKSKGKVDREIILLFGKLITTQRSLSTSLTCDAWTDVGKVSRAFLAKWLMVWGYVSGTVCCRSWRNMWSRVRVPVILPNKWRLV